MRCTLLPSGLTYKNCLLVMNKILRYIQIFDVISEVNCVVLQRIFLRKTQFNPDITWHKELSLELKELQFSMNENIFIPESSTDSTRNWQFQTNNQIILNETSWERNESVVGFWLKKKMKIFSSFENCNTLSSSTLLNTVSERFPYFHVAASS